MIGGTAGLVRADALRLPLRDASVDLIVTSPPYFSLRSYKDGDEHYDGQIGSEPTAQSFLEALWSVTSECWRVLKPSGSMFVNLGDKRTGSSGPGTTSGLTVQTRTGSERAGTRAAYEVTGFGRDKSKMLLPHRYAIGCEDGLADPEALGWVVRADLVWSKPNGLPESVRDRVQDRHEYWFHLTREGHYYSSVDEIREPLAYPEDTTRHLRGRRNITPGGDPAGGNTSSSNPLGRVPGSVWTIATEPLVVPAELEVEHFAAFPTEWPRRLISGWCPPAICVECGEGRFPVVERELVVDHVQRRNRGRQDLHDDGQRQPGSAMGATERSEVGTMVARIIGHACACTPYTDHPERRRPSQEGPTEDRARATGGTREDPGRDWPARLPGRDYHLEGWAAPPTRPAVVLDPFGGTGTVALVARALGRVGVSVDLSADYLRLARWRVFDSGHGAKVAARSWADRQQSLAL